MERHIRGPHGQTFTQREQGKDVSVSGPTGGCLGPAGPSGTYNNRGGRVAPSNAPGFLFGLFGR